MYRKLLDRWMAMSWEERRKMTRTMPPEILTCFAEALECEAKMLRLGHQQNVGMEELRKWQARKAEELLEAVFARESKDR